MAIKEIKKPAFPITVARLECTHKVRKVTLRMTAYSPYILTGAIRSLPLTEWRNATKRAIEWAIAVEYSSKNDDEKSYWRFLKIYLNGFSDSLCFLGHLTDFKKLMYSVQPTPTDNLWRDLAKN